MGISLATPDSRHWNHARSLQRGSGCCSACTEMGGTHGPAPEPASALLGVWETGRASWSPEERAAFLELQLLTAYYGSVLDAARALRDVARAEQCSVTATRVDGFARYLTGLFDEQVGDLQAAWDDGAACPFGIGLPPLSSLRPDLPLQRPYRVLTPSERLVFLNFAPEAGHRVVLMDAPTLARRTGLEVSDVHLALPRLLSSNWVIRRTEISHSATMATPKAFAPFTSGPWGSGQRTGARQ